MSRNRKVCALFILLSSESNPGDTGTTEGEGPSTPAKGPAATSLRSSKRLKFDPEIHGVGLEARFLGLQDDGFEKMISPRKNVRTDREKVRILLIISISKKFTGLVP